MRSLITAVALSAGALATTARAQATVDVQNDRKVAVTVYLELGQFDRRLGVVPAKSRATLEIPDWALVGRDKIQVFVHAEGEHGDLATQTLALKPGTHLALAVPASGWAPASPSDTMSAVLTPEELAVPTLTVDNMRNVPLTVFAEQGRWGVRLGTVAPKARATLRFPSAVVNRQGKVRLFVRPEGDLDLASESFAIKGSSHLALNVAK